MQQYFVDEIFAQPEALAGLLSHYEAQPPEAIAISDSVRNLILTGMGASFHAASILSYRWQRQGIRAQAIEATELLNYPGTMLDDCDTLIYVSQSGASGEVLPLLNRLPDGVKTIGITNDLNSPLGRTAQSALPLCAGDEQTVATKTYINSLALLSLLAGVSNAALQDIGGRIRQVLDRSEQVQSFWLEALAAMETLYFVGHGPHAFTARQSAMMVGEWAKRPAMYASIGAFRHGFLEAVTPETGIVIFAPAGPTQQSAFDLAAQLTGYGATVLLVQNGHAHRVDETPALVPLDDELLSPMVDVIPVQLFVAALARATGVETGFRHISKVIKAL